MDETGGGSPGGDSEDYRCRRGGASDVDLHRRGGERGCMQMEGRAPRTGTVFGRHLQIKKKEAKNELRDHFPLIRQLFL